MGDGLPRAIERRRRGGSTPELCRSHMRLDISTMLAARCVLCSRRRAKGRHGPGDPPIIHFRRPLGRSGPFSLALFFFVFEVAAFCFKRGLGLLPCCLVPWCRLGLRPLSGAGLFVVDVSGGTVAVAAGSPSVSVTSRCEVHVCLCFCGGTERCLEALLLVELEVPVCFGRASMILDSSGKLVAHDVVCERLILRRGSRVGVDVEEEHAVVEHVSCCSEVVGDLLEEAHDVLDVAGLKRFNNVLLRLLSD